MTPIEQLYYALGEAAYAMAQSDGAIQKEEREKLHNILIEEFKKNKSGFDLTEIIFQILQKDKIDTQTAYQWALKAIKLNSQYMSETLKQHFIVIMEKMASVFPPVTHEERVLLGNFIHQLKSIKGDPVFSSQTE